MSPLHQDDDAGKPNYLDPRVLSRVSRLELRARLVVEGFISGMHRSPYHGYSVEFAQYREYVPGDDIRHIDWKVWGRADRFFLKQYEEETNLSCQILLDCSKSMAYGRADGAGRMSKFDYAATLAAALAYLLQQQQDAVGAILFDRQVRCNLPPSSKSQQLQALVNELEGAVPDHRSDVAEVFTLLPPMIPRRGLVVLISDLFMDLESLRSMVRQFRRRRQEVVVFHVLHHDELMFPFADNTLFKGLETGQQLLTEPPALRKSYLAALAQFQSDARRLCTGNGCDYVGLGTHDNLGAGLSAYLASRRPRERRPSRG